MSVRTNKITQVETWKEADLALAHLERIELRLEKMRERADTRISEIEERLGEASAELLSEAYGLRQELERFFRGNTGSIRSRTLPSGRLGLRTSVCLEIKRPTTTIHRLVERGLGDCVRIRQVLDRQALRRLDEETLSSLGVKIRRRETFYAVPKRKE